MAGIWAVATDVFAFLQAYNGAVTALATIAIGGFTLALVIVTNRQAALTRVAAEAAKASADAASRTVASMEATAERQLRAYVNVNIAAVIDPLVPLSRRARIEIKNSGQTPAYDNSMFVTGCVREFPLNSVISPPPEDFPVGRETLPAGRTSVIEVPIGPLNNMEEHLLLAGNAAIYVAGEIRYRDVFGHRRITAFRLFCGGEFLAAGRCACDVAGNDAT